MSALRNRIRLNRARDELDRLARDVDAWIGPRLVRDDLAQYRTQLSALGGVLRGSLGVLRASIGKLADDGPTGEIYLEAAAHERRVLLVHRLFLYFRDKFEQRDDGHDPRLGRTLRAADELSFSFFVHPFRALGVMPGPQPLPYVEPYFSPRAIPRADPPPELRAPGDDILAQTLRELPIPLVGLPPASLECPWFLALLAHEVGHHVQYELLPGWKLVGQFRERLVGAAREAGLDEPGAKAWGMWSQEVFADAFSVAALGPWAVTILAEFVAADDRGLLEAEDSRYPCPAVRLALMAAMAKHLEVSDTSSLGDIRPDALATGGPLEKNGVDLRAAAARHLAVVDALASVAIGTPLVGNKSLAELAGFRREDVAPDERPRFWAEALLGEEPPAPDRSVRSTRQVMSGTVAAWHAMVDGTDAGAWAEQSPALRSNALALLAESGEPGTREAAAHRPAAELGAELGKRLLAREAVELGV